MLNKINMKYINEINDKDELTSQDEKKILEMIKDPKNSTDKLKILFLIKSYLISFDFFKEIYKCLEAKSLSSLVSKIPIYHTNVHKFLIENYDFNLHWIKFMMDLSINHNKSEKEIKYINKYKDSYIEIIEFVANLFYERYIDYINGNKENEKSVKHFGSLICCFFRSLIENWGYEFDYGNEKIYTIITKEYQTFKTLEYLENFGMLLSGEVYLEFKNLICYYLNLDGEVTFEKIKNVLLNPDEFYKIDFSQNDKNSPNINNNKLKEIYRSYLVKFLKLN